MFMKNEQLNAEEINRNVDEHLKDINNEFKAGFEILKKYPKSVTIFGSSRLTENSSHYNEAKKLAGKIVKELGYSIITGGGPGIMEAANAGAKDALGNSVGMNIRIGNMQSPNDKTTDSLAFDYFFTRKTMLTFAAEAYIFFPGGYGTFDELFEILTLVQTEKIPKVPVILFGKDFWNPLVDFFRSHMLGEHHTLTEEDMNMFVVTNSVDNVIKIIKDAPISEWWKMVD